MHRSGTSAIARSLAALGVYLGDNFLETQFDNPKGYWEDKGAVAINESVLAALGHGWEDVALLERSQFEEQAVAALRREAVDYLSRSFLAQPLWGFKDPRTVRLLPFWRRVLLDCGAADSYLVAIRNPLSVARSLFARQGMEAIASHRLWLVYMVPFLRDIAERAFVVLDYDSLMENPRCQLERVARALDLPPPAADSPEVDRFIAEFLDADLRHTRFSPHDFDRAAGPASALTREAYLWLSELAADRLEPHSSRFWEAWSSVEEGASTLLRDIPKTP